LFLGRAQVIHADGLPLEVQSAEVIDGWLSIRVRSSPTESFGRHGQQVPVVSGERFVISDEAGNELESSLVQASSGPLFGIVDIAFPTETELDLLGTLALRSASASVSFRLSQ